MKHIIPYLLLTATLWADTTLKPINQANIEAAITDDPAFRTAVGLGNVDNTSDSNKPVSAVMQTALDAKLAATNSAANGVLDDDPAATLKALQMLPDVPALYDSFADPKIYKSGDTIAHGSLTPPVIGNQWKMAVAGTGSPTIRNGALWPLPTIGNFYLANSTPSPNGKFSLGVRLRIESTSYAKYTSGATNLAGGFFTFAYGPSQLVADGGSISAIDTIHPAHLSLGTNLAIAGSYYLETSPGAGLATGNVVAITPAAYSLTTGDYVTLSQLTGTIPTGLTNGGGYYVIVNDSTHYRFATTRANALAGTAITLSSAGVAGWAVVQAFEQVDTNIPSTTNYVDLEREVTLFIQADGNYITFAVPGFGFRKYYHPRLSTKIGTETTHFFIEPGSEGVPPGTVYREVTSIVAVWANSASLDRLYSGASVGGITGSDVPKYGYIRNYTRKMPAGYLRSSLLTADHGIATDGRIVSMGRPGAASLQITGMPLDGEAITFYSATGSQGSPIAYRWKNTLLTSYDVKIGATVSESIANLILAIHATGTVGVNYGSGTFVNTGWRAYEQAGSIVTFEHYQPQNASPADGGLVGTTMTAGTVLNSGIVTPAIVPAFEANFGVDNELSRAVLRYGKMTASASSTGVGTETTLKSISIPPFNNIGEMVSCEARGYFATNGNNKTLNVYPGSGVGASTVATLTVSESATTFRVKVQISRQTSIGFLIYAEIETGGGGKAFGRFAAANPFSAYAVDYGAVVAALIRGNAAAGDIVLETFNATYSY